MERSRRKRGNPPPEWSGKVGFNRGRISRRGLADDAVGAAPAVTSHVIPGGPGRPSGSHYGEPAIAGRHGRNEREAKARVSPAHSETVREQKTPQKQRGRRKLVCVVERRRACARVSSADGTRSHAAQAEVSQTSAAVRITF